jgi:hypothetical protein
MVRLGVVARRSDQGVGVLDSSREHRVRCLDAAAGGKQRDVVAAVADGGAVADRAAVRGRQGAHRLDVAFGVKPAQLRVFGGAGRDPGQPLAETADFEQRQQATLGLGSFRMLIRLCERAGIREAGAAAGVMPEIAFVRDQTRLKDRLRRRGSIALFQVVGLGACTGPRLRESRP